MYSKDIMTTDVVTVGPETDIRTIARSLIERGISAVPVVDHAGRVIGIVSEGDLMRRGRSRNGAASFLVAGVACRSRGESA